MFQVQGNLKLQKKPLLDLSNIVPIRLDFNQIEPNIDIERKQIKDRLIKKIKKSLETTKQEFHIQPKQKISGSFLSQDEDDIEV